MAPELEPPPTAADELPFAAPCRTLEATASLRWVRQGWADYRRAPALSLAVGTLVVLLSLAIVAIGRFYGGYWIEIALLSGFIFVGPVVALMFYAVSWQIENGRVPTARDCIARIGGSFGNLMVFTLVLMIVFLLWGRSATALHIFFPIEGRPALAQLLPFLGIGFLVGSVFALIVFTFSAFAMPMIMDRRIDAVTAVITSTNAVLRNKPAMAVWIALIVAGIAIGFATAMIGLAVTMPVLGYATWHGYRETIDASPYPPADPRG